MKKRISCLLVLLLFLCGVSTLPTAGAAFAPDTKAPVISKVAASTITSNSTVVSWNTNEAASTQVEYGTTTAYGLVSTLNTTLLKSHSQTLSGLASSTLYNYRVKSADAAGNVASSTNKTFTTAAPADTTAPIISSIAASTITGNSALISWITDENSTTQVEYGPTTAYGSLATLNATLLTSHSQTLNNLAQFALYNYRVISMDAAGNVTTSKNNTFTTLDTTAPAISSIAAGTITGNSALISWITDENSTTQVEYGSTTAYGSLSTLNATLLTSHSQTLSNLAQFTLYNYRVISMDASGNVTTSKNNTFTTLDTTTPVISSIAAGTITGNSALISWITDEVSTTQVEYGSTTAYGSLSTLKTALATSHSQTLSNLAQFTLYNYRVISMDAAGNVATSNNNTFTTLDTTAPVISSIAAGTISGNSALINWITDQGSTTQIEYGLTTAYGSLSTLNATLLTSHSQVLSGLTPSTLYNYQVTSTDAAENVAISQNNTFTTVEDGITPFGIYVIDSMAGTYRDANIRDVSFVDGYAWRMGWGSLETSEGVYDFSAVDHIICKLEPINKKLTMVSFTDPSYISQKAGVTTWTDSTSGTMRAVPWDTYLIQRFQAFTKALADHPVPSCSPGGTMTLFKDHPILTNLSLGVAGVGGLRDTYDIQNFSGYTRTGLENAVLQSLHAATDNFPTKTHYLGFWPIVDQTSLPSLWQDVGDKILAEFNGVKNPNMSFFQDNLAASKDPVTGVVTGYPVTDYAKNLDYFKDFTTISFQALQSWDQPFQDVTKTANTVPNDAFLFADTTYKTKYYEIYVADIDNSQYSISFQQWHDYLAVGK